MRSAAQRRRSKRPYFLVNGYPDGESVERRAEAWARLRRMHDSKSLRAKAEIALVKLKEMEPIALLDCSYAAQDLFNAVPRLSSTDQATLVDYVEMRLDMWRKTQAASGSPEGQSE